MLGNLSKELDTSLQDFHELLVSSSECARASTPGNVLSATFCRLWILKNSRWLTTWDLQAVLQKKQTSSKLD